MGFRIAEIDVRYAGSTQYAAEKVLCGDVTLGMQAMDVCSRAASREEAANGKDR